MKTTFFIFISIFVLSLNGWPQKKRNQQLYRVDLTNREKFIGDSQSLISRMERKRIVALGEGTHGTAEFYKLRYWITRELVEKKGFTHIAFENDLSDGLLLNEELNSEADLSGLMKKRLLSIWQNEETRELLAWVRDYNRKHRKQIIIDGIDYVYLNADIEALQKVLANHAGFLKDIEPLKKPASLQDAGWEAMNGKDAKIDFNAMMKSSYQGYLLADSLDQRISVADLPAHIKAETQLILLNIKQGFAPFYHEITKTKEVSRDVNMAGNVARILKNPKDKMVIWAHNAHVAKAGVYNSTVGGMGGELAKLFPDAYFVMGTGTATGTFAATEQSRDTYTNPMKAYPLEQTVADAWETGFLKSDIPAFYLFPAQYNQAGIVKPLRFIGYTPQSGPETNEQTNISKHFDAFLFISRSNAATPLK